MIQSKGRSPKIDKKKGFKVFNAIRGLLNTFEYISAGVHQKVFDEKIIRELFEGSLVKAYFNLEEYIVHVNDVMSAERKGKAWGHLKRLAKRYYRSWEDVIEEREQTG